MFRVLGRLTATLLMLAGSVFVLPATEAYAAFPDGGNGTHFIDKDVKLAGFANRGWLKANIPFLDLPASQQQLEDVYYYRWRVWQEHLQYTTNGGGYVVTEFLNKPGYSAPFGAIGAAAGHHIYEGRWLREQSYLDDYIRYWLQGAGRTDTGRTGVQRNFAHFYSTWLVDATYQRAAATGDWTFPRSLQNELIRQFDEWGEWDSDDPQLRGNFDKLQGLYWQFPRWDATEYNLASYRSGDPANGGKGFRPTINSYQYADALAISEIARMNGATVVADDFADRAAKLKQNMRRLWGPGRQFFFHLKDEDKKLLAGRELAGLVPWQFGAAKPEDAEAWRLLDDSTDGFGGNYGPTTAERIDYFYMKDAENGCCRWNGPSWPFQTSQVLTGMAKLLHDSSAPQNVITKGDYVAQLRKYAATQYKNGKPYVAEAHHPDENRWLYDGRDHSEDYLHSTYTDLVISGLIGLSPQAGDILRIAPLAPATWDYFALENVPYHGRNVTVLWDRTGDRYGQGAGLHVYVDGNRVATQPDLSEVSINVAGGVAGGVATPWLKTHEVNAAANPNGNAGPQASASYTFTADQAKRVIDGKIYFTDVPNTRWTSYRSPNATDHLEVDLGATIAINTVRVHFYDDGGGVRVPTSYRLLHDTGSTFAEIPQQKREPAIPAANEPNEISFPTVRARKIRIVAPNRQGDVGWGVVELEVPQPRQVPDLPNGYVPLVNRSSEKCLDVAGQSTQNGAEVHQWSCLTPGNNQHWQLRPSDPGWYTIVAKHSGLCADVKGWSTEVGAELVQWACHGGANQQWALVPADNGYFKLRNRNSGKYLDLVGCSAEDSASISQYPSYNNHCQQFRVG